MDDELFHNHLKCLANSVVRMVLYHEITIV